MLIVNIGLLLVYPVGLPIIVSYIFGWDLISYTYYVMRVFVFNVICAVQAGLLSGIQFAKLNMLKYYGCVKQAKYKQPALEMISPTHDSKLLTKNKIRSLVKQMIDEEAANLGKQETSAVSEQTHAETEVLNYN